MPGSKEPFTVAEWELIPYHVPSDLPAKIGFIQLIFHTDSPLYLPLPPRPAMVWFFSVSKFMYSSSPFPHTLSHALCKSELSGHNHSCHHFLDPSFKWNCYNKVSVYKTDKNTCGRAGYRVVNHTDSGDNLAGCWSWLCQLECCVTLKYPASLCLCSFISEMGIIRLLSVIRLVEGVSMQNAKCCSWHVVIVQ